VDIQYQTCGAGNVGASKKTFDGAEHFGIESMHPEQALDCSEDAWIIIYDKNQLSCRHQLSPWSCHGCWGRDLRISIRQSELFTLLQASVGQSRKALVFDRYLNT
jgi:hypothetical protein